ncbi:hypothetical protein HCCG_00075 [Helicobacter cinaedi CCUG 18818 = ATCC BAA-847]|uniref:Uncharacterized protein n=1 Tax=Helicobacter cinaedi CCUG 18818 = ATCC BAA-847 TaxID=537971 RepID=A0ABN0BA41_9HELI|nr:hypothetical protein HCCG_00075 [Helicobacter cinaedi CCUG 18818 = ATCC BAA-847]
MSSGLFFATTLTLQLATKSWLQCLQLYSKLSPIAKHSAMASLIKEALSFLLHLGHLKKKYIFLV